MWFSLAVAMDAIQLLFYSRSQMGLLNAGTNSK